MAVNLWICYAILAFLVSLVCYVTNPIVVLFCDENGELPSFLKYWQTWDDSCDSQYFMSDVCPKFLDYGYDKHYVHVYRHMDDWTNRKRHYSIKKFGTSFTFKEKLQRYICRVWWLTRNCGYGFAFYLFGKYIDGTNCPLNYNKDGVHIIGGSNSYFMYKDDSLIFKLGKYGIYHKYFFGWKIDTTKQCQCMLANRIAFAIHKE